MGKCECGKEIRGPICGAVLAPFVILKATGGSKEIKVGNESAPGNSNRAIIKSFQFGHDDGVGANLEIYDEAGGDFLNFAKNVFNDPSRPADANNTATVQWGWVVTDCSGTSRTFQSKVHNFVILQVNINFASGGATSGFIFKLELTELLNVNLDTRVIETIGEDISGRTEKIKEAIKEICKKAKPPITNVEFVKAPQGGGGGACNFLDAGCVGGPVQVRKGGGEFKFEAHGREPEFVWRGTGNNLLEILRDWIKNFRTENNHGVIITWDEINNKLVFQESPIPACGFFDNPNSDFSLPNIGTYIVNGGNSSPVIAFNPQIKWPFVSLNHTGAQIGPEEAMTRARTAVEGALPFGCNDDGNASRQDAGATTRGSHNEQAQEMNVTGREGASAQTVHERVNLVVPLPIEAELTIQGDPSLDEPLMLKTHACGIAFINPFHVTQQGDCEWQQLAGGPCNSCLTNKQWIIKSVAHSIQAGTYVTTLKVFLPYLCRN
jgi:hypothetical protein